MAYPTWHRRGRVMTSLNKISGQTVRRGVTHHADEHIRSSAGMSERFVDDGRLRLRRNDARSTGCHGIRGTRATRSHQAESEVEARVRH